MKYILLFIIGIIIFYLLIPQLEQHYLQHCSTWERIWQFLYFPFFLYKLSNSFPKRIRWEQCWKEKSTWELNWRYKNYFKNFTFCVMNSPFVQNNEVLDIIVSNFLSGRIYNFKFHFCFPKDFRREVESLIKSLHFTILKKIRIPKPVLIMIIDLLFFFHQTTKEEINKFYWKKI